VLGLELRGKDLGFMFLGVGLRVDGLEFRGYGLGFGV
jgi:hypothetical protein